MRLDEAYEVICKNYKISYICELRELLDNAYGSPISDKETDGDIKQVIILPFCGNINAKCCKSVVYNHGLYTQCSKETNDITCKTCTKLKYGSIEDRIKSKPNEFVTPEGKKEIPYHKFVEKMEYKMEDVNEALYNAGIIYTFGDDIRKPIKKGRGRPKKIHVSDNEVDNEDDDKMESLNVMTIEIGGIMYFKTVKNVLLNTETYAVVGRYINDKIVAIN
jgi:DNA-binding protein YbaB